MREGNSSTHTQTDHKDTTLNNVEELGSTNVGRIQIIYLLPREKAHVIV